MNIQEINWLELRNIIKNIWNRYLCWDITFNEWKEESQIYIDEVNRRQQQLAKKYWKKQWIMTFANTCR